jgi:hypothetical protein
MGRFFLCMLVFCLAVVAFGQSMNIDRLVADKWILVAQDDSAKVRAHGVRLVFHNDPAGLRGATINWNTGAEIPLASLRFDGSRLELQLNPDANSKRPMPTLVTSLAGDQFEGYWVDATTKQALGPKLKIVRYK